MPSLSGESSSLIPLQPCLPGGGQRLVVVEKEAEYSTSGLCSHLWWRVRFAVTFGVWLGSVRGRLCGAVSLQPASPWVLLVSALCPFAGSSECHMPVHGPMARWEVGLCHVSAPFQPLFCSLHLLGLTSSCPRLCWGRFWLGQEQSKALTQILPLEGTVGIERKHPGLGKGSRA